VKKVKILKKVDYDVYGWEGSFWKDEMDDMVGEEVVVVRADSSDNTFQIKYLNNYYWIPFEATSASREYTLTVNKTPVIISIPVEVHEMLISGTCKITLCPNEYTV
jgi:hypothetical protein